MKEKILNKFLRYVKIDTQSNDNSETTPSTTKQFDLANLLVEELKAIGIKDAAVDEHCYVYATIPATKKDVPTIAFLAHLDTSPDVSGKDVKPQIIENYQGGDIILPADKNVIIRMDENPALKNCIGNTIITTDGTTLLGSDDKSGVAAIMMMCEILMNDTTIKHGDIRICFTPDEEIGRGTQCIDLNKLNATYAYTIDGDMLGELNKETFSADAATINIKGRDIHPGMAKDIMINAGRVMGDIIARLPKDMAPETTDNYQPFIHPTSAVGNISNAQIKFILRDFKTTGLDTQKQILQGIIDEVQQLYPKAIIELETKKQYRNMFDALENNHHGCDLLWNAVEEIGVRPFWKPIRGGTDGSRLTEMGLPTPNIFTGGQNFHSKTEWVSLDVLCLSVETIICLCKKWSE